MSYKEREEYGPSSQKQVPVTWAPGHSPLVTGLCVYWWGGGSVDPRCVLLCNLISPWADAGQVSHRLHEHFSCCASYCVS